MTTRFLFVLVGILGLGTLLACRQEVRRTEVEIVSLDSFIRTHNRTPSTASYAWEGKTVQVTLNPKERRYKVYEWGVGIESDIPNAPPVVMFLSERKIDTAGDTLVLIVTGRCHGRVNDGVRRSRDINWYIRVDNCSIDVTRPVEQSE